jgi:hypothetical protein
VEPLVVMYTAPHPASTAINGMASDMIDGSGTIDPAALNTPGNDSLHPGADARAHMGLVQAPRATGAPGGLQDGPPLTVMGTCRVRTDGMTTRLANVNVILVSVIPPSSAVTAARSSPRGLKRSRSPEESEDSPVGGADDGMWSPRMRSPARAG